jgi:ABC-2 type transport system permease protein/ribosome-dependent ATPase
MNIKRIIAVASKEWLEIVRDRLFFALAFIVPATLMLLFGFGLSFDVEDLPFAVIDRDNSALSRDYAYRFINSRYFELKGYSRDERQLAPLLSDNRLRLFIVIPEHFQKDLMAGRPVSVQTHIDGTYPFRANTAKGYVSAINHAYSMEMLSGHLSQRYGIRLEQAQAMLQPVKLGVRYLYNQSLNSIWSVAPKLIMAILLISPPFLTALGVVREKESGSIYNIYASTVSRMEFLIGKLAPYVAISALNALLLFVFARLVYGAPFKGGLLFFTLATLLYVICTTGIGLLVSIFAKTQIAAMIVSSIVTVVPATLYSGVIIPISSLSQAAQVAAHLLPAMYYTNIVLGCFLKGVGVAALWLDVLVLAVYATLLFTAGYLLFTKRPRV